MNNIITFKKAFAIVFALLIFLVVLMMGIYFVKKTNNKPNLKRAAVFAIYAKNGEIYPDIYDYLQELKKYSQYIIVVGDNDYIQKSDLEKLNKYADEYYFKRHGEYDFGSYKIGYFKLKEKGILQNVDKLLLCNDSVIWQKKSLESFFQKESKHDFFGLTYHYRGILEKSHKWADLPHLQSYLLSISSNIFNSIWFEDFMKSIKKEDNKFEVIAKYEIGISVLIRNNGYKLNSYYPKIRKFKNRNFEPCGFFLSKNSDFLWVKKMFIKRKPMSMFNP